LAAVNGQMLQLATDGNPKLVRQYVRTWLTASRCDRDGEAIDFDHLDSATAEHWRGHYADLPPVLLDTLAEASLYHSDIAPRRLVRTGVSEADIVRQLEHLAACGWLKRSPVNSQDGSFRFACRSARNAVRCRLGSDGLQSHATAVLRSDRAESLPPADSWTLSRLSGSGQGVPDAGTLWDARRDLLDTKLATYALLIEYRRQRWTRRGELSSLASDIGDGYAALGSVRRQKRWAKLAFTEMRRRQPETTLSLDAARSLCRLYSLSDDLQEKMTTLSDLLDSNTAADSHVRGLLLSELSVAHLLKSEFQVACNRFFEAHHLLGTAAPESKEYVRNLNRLGLSLMRVGRFAAARKHLEQCRKLAQQFGFEYIRRLALGNLVILEWDMGDPHTAMQRSQRVLAEYRAAHDPLGYLAALQDKVMCQVNLGLCYAAARTARLAERLANLHSDPFELRHALNNLGWVLTMHGEVKEGRTYLNAAVRLHLRMDDSLWAARSRLNLAWNLLLVADLAEAERLCQTALEEILRHGDLQGQYEALRILSQIAIMREDFATAQKYLEDMPMDDPLFSPRNKAEASLAWLNLYVWTQQQSAAKHLIHELTDNAIVANVHPLQCDYERLRGFWHMLEGDHQRSLDILGTTAIDCRKSGRIDKLLDTMVALALLAGRMRNWSVGLRYLRAGKQMVDSMRGQLS
jgi:tetratricopeptide (TPR) repeat protein